MRIPAAFALFFLAAGAQAYGGPELLADCQAAEALHSEKRSTDPYQSVRSTRCLAYVSGFADGYELTRHLAGQVGVGIDAFCLPAPGDDLQYRLVRAVLAHLERQPPGSETPVRILVAGALSKAFPCADR